MTQPGAHDGTGGAAKTDEFQVQIEFSGLCLFVVRKDKERVSVLMPDARREPNVETMRHHDGTEAVPHSGYLRYDQHDLMPNVFPITPNNSVGPRNEGIHRFNREELTLNLGAPPEIIKFDELEFPDFGDIDDDLQINPAMLGDSPPDLLLMRMDLTGGEFTAHSGGSNWTFPDRNGENGPYQGQFANYVTWTRTVKGSALKLNIGPFGKNPTLQLTLHPSVNRLIRLKVANLCAENPLEWPDLKIRVIASDQDQDKDFKWLYRLLATKDSVPVPVGAGEAAHQAKLQVPILDRTSGPASAEQDCTGGKIDE